MATFLSLTGSRGVSTSHNARGFHAEYYAEPEERPFLMVIEPIVESDGSVVAKSTFLAPHFEEDRVRQLGIPATERHLHIITWEEHWNPYQTLRTEIFGRKDNVTLMVDEELRDYIVRGLTSSGFHTVGLAGRVEEVRQQKTPAEIDILRAVNTGTVQALRAMRPCELFPQIILV
jgi:Xaa-Pro aminopeptidase